MHNAFFALSAGRIYSFIYNPSDLQMTIKFPKVKDSFPKCEKHSLRVKVTQGEHVPDSQRETKIVRTEEDHTTFDNLDYWSTYIIEIMVFCDWVLVEHAIEDQDTGPGSKLLSIFVV